MLLDKYTRYKFFFFNIRGIIEEIILIANFHRHALSAVSLINKSMKNSMSTVKVPEFPEFGELKLCVIANRWPGAIKDNSCATLRNSSPAQNLQSLSGLYI